MPLLITMWPALPAVAAAAPERLRSTKSTWFAASVPVISKRPAERTKEPEAAGVVASEAMLSVAALMAANLMVSSLSFLPVKNWDKVSSSIAKVPTSVAQTPLR